MTDQQIGRSVGLGIIECGLRDDCANTHHAADCGRILDQWDERAEVEWFEDIPVFSTHDHYTENYERIYVETEIVNTYSQKYIMWKCEKQPVRIVKKMLNRNSFPIYYVTKFSYQDGDPMLSSPVMIRWAEVILNRAEAYAKLEKKQEALDDVNTIRRRAGLTGDELFTLENMTPRGYLSALDIVLDERRLELSFEGFRTIDIYRNKHNMDRRYAGVHPWEIVNYTDNKIQYPIPFDETSVSGIPQNPNYY